MLLPNATLFSSFLPISNRSIKDTSATQRLLPFFCILMLGCLGTSCTETPALAALEGQIRGLSEAAEITVKKKHIHYKFSDPVLETQRTSSDGSFRFEFEALNAPAVYELQYEGNSHPVYVEPGEQQHISFHHAAFPDLNEVSGRGASFYEAYQQYLVELEEAERHLRSEQQKMREGRENDVLNIQRLKIQVAKEYLADTPFSFRIKRHLGEFLTSSLEHLHELYEGSGAGSLSEEAYARRRAEVLEMAAQYDFFERSSLEAQRAGIRDFATTWVATASAGAPSASAPVRADGNIATTSVALIDTVFEGSSQEQRAREMKWELVSEIDQPAGQRHAVMYFIAEELGEGDYETGRHLLQAHKSFLEQEPELLSFLETLRGEVARTQPGQPAIAFTIPDENGNPVSMSDFEGRYVLLDFWASWCMPCINALPGLEKLYQTYDRRDLEIISISVEENEQLWRNALERFPQPWIQLYDGTGFDQETFRAYRAGSIPFYVLIDREGNILRNNDFSPGEELEHIIRESLEAEADYTYAQQ